ncbi:MAG: hypothetical protein ACAI25_18775 [Planctomycetota bacterium]
MKGALVALLVVLGGAIALAADETDVRGIEKDTASVDTKVRATAYERAEKLKQSGHKVRLLCKAAEDPDPEIQKRARDKLLNLDARDARHLRPDRLAGPLLRATEDEDRLQLLQIIENGLESGSRFPPGPLLGIAIKTKDKSLRERVLRCALLAVDIAPIGSAELAPIHKLLASSETRETAIDIVVRSESPEATRILLEMEANAGGVDPESEKVKSALDARAALEGFVQQLEEIAKNDKDERLRAAAKKRLEPK